jgi:hypothetical protein
MLVNREPSFTIERHPAIRRQEKKKRPEGKFVFETCLSIGPISMEHNASVFTALETSVRTTESASPEAETLIPIDLVQTRVVYLMQGQMSRPSKPRSRRQLVLQRAHLEDGICPDRAFKIVKTWPTKSATRPDHHLVLDEVLAIIPWYVENRLDHNFTKPIGLPIRIDEEDQIFALGWNKGGITLACVRSMEHRDTAMVGLMTSMESGYSQVPLDALFTAD